MSSTTRKYSLNIWALALGYFALYVPYAALVKAITGQLLVEGPVPGLELLPSTVIATAVSMPVIITALGWWKYAGSRRVLGCQIPWPSRWTCISGFCTAVIIITTTLAYTFTGVSVLLALILLRAGVLIIAPLVDVSFRRKVRWFSWSALAFSLAALVVALSDIGNYMLTTAAVINIAAYVTGYLLRLPCMTSVAKSGSRNDAYRYFVEEQLVAMAVLVSLPALYAAVGSGQAAMSLRIGFTTFLYGDLALPGFMAGICYAGLYVFGTLVYLDRRENTFCVALNRSSSLLSGLAASYLLMIAFGKGLLTPAQLTAALLIVIALLLLSPLHHLDRFLARLEGVLARSPLLHLGFFTGHVEWLFRAGPSVHLTGGAPVPHRVNPNSSTRLNAAQRVFLFVCGGNTARSPMAQALCNAEIARRLNISVESQAALPFVAASAGLNTTGGVPLRSEATSALAGLGLRGFNHTSNAVTTELVQESDLIFCMTSRQREELMRRFPSAAGKTHCLDPAADLEEPAEESGFEQCARRLRELICARLDQMTGAKGFATATD